MLNNFKNGIIKFVENNKNIMAFITIFIIPMCIFLYCKFMHFIFGWGSGTTDGWLGFLGAYFGAIIAIGGIYWQVSVENKAERKNNFDTAVALENYKRYMDFSNKCMNTSNFIDEKVKKFQDMVYSRNYTITSKSKKFTAYVNDFKNETYERINELNQNLAIFKKIQEFYSKEGHENKLGSNIENYVDEINKEEKNLENEFPFLKFSVLFHSWNYKDLERNFNKSMNLISKKFKKISEELIDTANSLID